MSVALCHQAPSELDAAAVQNAGANPVAPPLCRAQELSLYSNAGSFSAGHDTAEIEPGLELLEAAEPVQQVEVKQRPQ